MVAMFLPFLNLDPYHFRLELKNEILSIVFLIFGIFESLNK